MDGFDNYDVIAAFDNMDKAIKILNKLSEISTFFYYWRDIKDECLDLFMKGYSVMQVECKLIAENHDRRDTPETLYDFEIVRVPYFSDAETLNNE